MTNVIHLPDMPRTSDFGNIDTYYDALKAWTSACLALADQGHAIQPPPMPKTSDFGNIATYYDALKAWKSVCGG